MLHLRLTQRSAGKNQHRVEVSLQGGGARQAFASTFDFFLLDQDEEDLRWYLEEYLQYPQDPAPAIARRVEERMAEIGTELFRAVFQASDDARDLWAVLRNRLPEARVEIVTGVSEANTIPWELLRDPRTDTPIALSARSFVRAQPTQARRPRLPKEERDKIRILLVICRPMGDEDVPFRSVASRLIKGLDEANREAYDLDVLRPPTFEQLGRVLRQAEQDGRPYHVVHFDGHGAYGEIAGRPGRHGYVLFEKEFGGDADPVDGSMLGELLVEARVPVLVLNACRSAHAEPAAEPDSTRDPQSQARVFGSLAQEVMNTGAAGVLAMGYNVYVVTVAQLVAELYASLGRGSPLGEAVTRARRNLHENPLRKVAFSPLPLQDWTVPIVHEAAPVRLFRKNRTGTGKRLRIQITAAGAPRAEGSFGSSLPPPPVAGFFGQDNTLLALDRAFNYDEIVLLHAYAGSGKTATAAEFARWYSLTGGIEGPILFTSFERYLPLPRVLDPIGHVFEARLEGQGIHWLALDDPARRAVTLQLLSEVPVLWIWDNVEPVTGFPAGTEPAWSPREQDELVRFLREAQRAKAKFLLTSRRDESAWLGVLPTRVAVPPMPLLESLQLARSLAAQRGRQLSGVEDWRPLLELAQGNPMTITVLVGQALREGLATKRQIESFVARLRSGEAAFIDERDEGRARSLGASLAYGFENAFNQEECRKLALLHLFQGFVNVITLHIMGIPETPWCLPEVRGLTREEAAALLDRATEVGLLTAHGDGRYSIHPALPWFFKRLFEESHPAEKRLAAVRAFVESMGELGSYCHDEYREGGAELVNVLKDEEANLLHARQWAKAYGWWGPLISVLQGIRQLYAHTGRRAEWQRSVEEIVPCFVDPADDSPLPGLEEEWSVVMSYRVGLAREERRLSEAERLQNKAVAWSRTRAASLLERPVAELEEEERNVIKKLGTSLNGLGQIRLESGQEDCIPAYEEALECAVRIGNQADAAIYSFNLGQAFLRLPGLCDLDRAEDWHRKSLELRVESDTLGRGTNLAELGAIALKRFQQALVADQPQEEWLPHLDKAVQLYHDALDCLPPDAASELAVIHHQLGLVYQGQLEIDRSLFHSRQAIQEHERAGNPYAAAQSRLNTAVTLLIADRREDALEYAMAAWRGFESYGEKAVEEIERTRQLIAKIRGD